MIQNSRGTKCLWVERREAEWNKIQEQAQTAHLGYIIRKVTFEWYLEGADGMLDIFV